jgi:Icc-related predicted phosphoesterase
VGQIPSDTDILVAHTPPWGVCDRTIKGEEAGCPELLSAIKRVRPALVVFGHIQEAYGVGSVGGSLCLNVSLADANQRIWNRPFLIDLIPKSH